MINKHTTEPQVVKDSIFLEFSFTLNAFLLSNPYPNKKAVEVRRSPTPTPPSVLLNAKAANNWGKLNT